MEISLCQKIENTANIDQKRVSSLGIGTRDCILFRPLGFASGLENCNPSFKTFFHSSRLFLYCGRRRNCEELLFPFLNARYFHFVFKVSDFWAWLA